MGCGMIFIKYLVFILNLLFAITGLIILTVGAIILSTYTHYSSFVGDALWSAPILMIIVGATVCVIAFFGCCGAAKENSCMILTFSVFLVIIFLLEIGIGIAGYLKHKQLHHILESGFNSTLDNYGTSEHIRISWKFLQTELDCCGIEGPTDWQNVFHNSSLPRECCHVKPQSVEECTIDHASTEGCMPKLFVVLNQKALLLGGIGIGIAIAQLLGVAFACCLSRSFKRNYETV